MSTVPRVILADPAIPGVEEAFGRLGQVRLVPGRGWRPVDVSGADLLVVRSVTRVDERLIAGSRVRFVGSVTSGTDHVDLDALRRRGVAFAHARGANARAVAEYVLAAVAASRPPGASLAGLTAGVIGCGAIGGLVAGLLEGLGLAVWRNDPPRERAGEPGPWCTLERAMGADVVTVHVPLEPGGSDPTVGLIGPTALAAMRPDAVLVNAARGGVVDEAALRARLAALPGLRAVIDCWAGEPALDPRTLGAAWLATPHIAGYTLEARTRATERVYRAACAFLGEQPDWRPALPPAGPLPAPRDDVQDPLCAQLLAAYDIVADSERLRAAVATADGPAAGFEAARAGYRPRREWPGRPLAAATGLPGAARAALGLGAAARREHGETPC